MAVSGDLATIDLPDLLQNIEAHSRTGTMVLTGEHGASRVLFRGGRISGLVGAGRVSLGDRLVAAGHVTRRRLENARKKASSKRSVPQLLVASRAISEDDLMAAAEYFLGEDVVDLIASAHGAFEFAEGEPDGQSFDADELALDLGLQASPLILEATRRVDHWAEIRKYLPTDSMHFKVREGSAAPEGAEDPELADAIIDALDGTRSVSEVTEQFPDRRFECHKLLAEFVRDHVAKPLSASNLLAIAESIERREPDRARELVRRGLVSEARHEDLLEVEARLAERLGDLDGSATARKLLAHLQLESGRTEQAQAELELAKQLVPNDPTVVERCLSVALLQGRRQDAVQEGMRLVELYRAPGLHTRAVEVLERLMRVDPDSIELEVELAQSRVDCGESKVATHQLLRRGKALVAGENYLGARILFEAVLGIDPAHREAVVSVEMIDKEVYSQRRERKRRIVRRCITAGSLLFAAMLVWTEFMARLGYVEMRSVVGRERLVEEHQYDEAITLWRQYANEYAFSLTAQLDVPRLIGELEQRKREHDSAVNGLGADERFR